MHPFATRGAAHKALLRSHVFDGTRLHPFLLPLLLVALAAHDH